jgi:hypothetical protein
MFRELIAVLLVGATLHAQSEATRPKLPFPSQPVPRAETYERFTELRQGSTEDIAFLLFVTGVLVSSRSPVAGIEGVSLTLDPEPGLDYTRPAYPKSSPQRFPFRSGKIPVHNGAFPVELRIHADSAAAVGRHSLHGRIRYQAITFSGVSAPQEMEVLFTLMVVPPDAKVTRIVDWPIHHTSVARTIGLVLLVIALLPLMIAILPFYLPCVYAGKCE